MCYIDHRAYIHGMVTCESYKEERTLEYLIEISHLLRIKRLGMSCGFKHKLIVSYNW